MATIQNLYIMPEEAARAADLVLEALIAEGMLRGTATVGPAFETDPVRRKVGIDIVEPQHADGIPVLPPYDRLATRHASLSEALANYRARPGARLFVAPVNEAHPAIQRDFDLYQGAEWALGVYDAPDGYRLHRFHEIHAFDDEGNPIGEPELAIDRTLRAWIHLQGKVAPWTDLFSGSGMDQLIRRFWPNRELFEFPYF